MTSSFNEEQLELLLGAAVHAAMEAGGTDTIEIMAEDKSRSRTIEFEMFDDRIVFRREPLPDENEAFIKEFQGMIELICKVDLAQSKGLPVEPTDELSAIFAKALLTPIFAMLRCPKCGNPVNAISKTPSCPFCQEDFSFRDLFNMAGAAFDSRA